MPDSAFQNAAFSKMRDHAHRMMPHFEECGIGKCGISKLPRLGMYSIDGQLTKISSFFFYCRESSIVMTPLWSEISALSTPHCFRACKSRVSSFNSFLLASKNAIIFTIELDILSRDAVTLGWNFKLNLDDIKIQKRPVLFYSSVVGISLQIE